MINDPSPAVVRSMNFKEELLVLHEIKFLDSKACLHWLKVKSALRINASDHVCVTILDGIRFD